MEKQLLTGKIKFFDSTRGFGFIIQDHSEENLFFHHSACKTKSIKPDDLVSYVAGETKRGACAEDVTVL